MRPMTLDEGLFDEVAKTRGAALVSILLPTHVKGPEIAQDRIRLKNALSDIEGMLSEAGWRRSDREARLGKARGLLDDDDFWAHQGRGLALYIDGEGEIRPVALGDEPPAMCIVADSHHIRHLLVELMEESLPALVLTKGAVALYLVDSRQASAIDADLPSSFDDVNWFMDRERQEQRHADSAGSAGVRHGHDPQDRMTEDLHRFLRAVSQAVTDAIGSTSPLVVLGDEPLIDDFRPIADREVVALGLDGTGRFDSASEIGKRVRPVVADRVAAALVTNNQAARDALGTADTVTLFPDALYAAVSGRLSHVFVQQDASPVWGRFDAAALDAAAGSDQGVGSVDLLDRLIDAARTTGAGIRVMEGDADGSQFVGVRRF
ncbi:MAG: hypothetical protein WD990_06705 [Acidimicrobiia bacterium]